MIIFLITACSKSPPSGNLDTSWMFTDSDPLHNISGLAVSGHQVLLVHDNKDIHQPRVSTVLLAEDDNTFDDLQTLQWEAPMLPRDLESVCSIPNRPVDYCFMQSDGRCYIGTYQHDHQTVFIQRSFMLPQINDPYNLEAIAMVDINTRTMLLWADRGSEKRPGLIAWGWLNESTGKVNLLGKVTVSVSSPTENIRHITDLALDGDVLYFSAATDPGDNGPFTSAIYALGDIQRRQPDTFIVPYDSPRLVSQSPARKIEALGCTPQHLYIGTDDENLGAALQRIPAPSLNSLIKEI